MSLNVEIIDLSILTNTNLAGIPDRRASAVAVAVDVDRALAFTEAALILAEVVSPPGSPAYAAAAVVDVGRAAAHEGAVLHRTTPASTVAVFRCIPTAHPEAVDDEEADCITTYDKKNHKQERLLEYIQS